MAVSTKRIAKNTTFLYLRMILVMLVSLYTVRLTLSVLGVEDYGIYSAVGGVVAALSSLSAVLSGASQRFYSIELGNEKSARIHIIFYTMIKVYLLVLLFILLVGGSVGLWFVCNYLNLPLERANVAYVIYITSLFAFLSGLMASPFQGLIIAKEDMGIYAYVSIIEVFLKLSLVALLNYIEYDKLILYGVLLMLSQMIVSLIYVSITFCKYKEIRVRPEIDKCIFKQIFSFSGWTLFGSIANVANLQGMNIILNIFFGPIANAAYAIGNQVTYAVNSFGTNFFTAVKPGLMKTFATSDKKKMFELLEMSTKVSYLLLLVMVLPLCIEVKIVLTLWLGTIGEYMMQFTILMLIYVLVLSLNNPITTIVQAAGKVKIYHGIIDTFTLLTIPLAILAFKLGAEPWTVFVINIFIFCLAQFIRMQLLYKITGYNKMTYVANILIPIFKLILISAPSCIVVRYFLQFDSYMDIIRIPIECLIIIIVGWFSILSKDEQTKIMLIVKSKISK